MKKYINQKGVYLKEIRNLFNNYELTLFRRKRISLFISKLAKYKLAEQEQKLINKIKREINFEEVLNENR